MKKKSDAEHFVMTIDWVWVKQMFFDILLPSKTELLQKAHNLQPDEAEKMTTHSVLHSVLATRNSS